jgi:hypothetical protein
VCYTPTLECNTLTSSWALQGSRVAATATARARCACMADLADLRRLAKTVERRHERHIECGNATGTVPKISALELVPAVTA